MLRGQRRGRNEVNARQIAMYLIRRMTNLSLNDIGKEFGDRDHTTVLHSLDKVEKQMRPRLCRGGEGDHHQHQRQTLTPLFHKTLWIPQGKDGDKKTPSFPVEKGEVSSTNSSGEKTVSQQGFAAVFHKKILYCGCY